MPRESFEEILLEAVDEALSSLGESSKEAIYFHIKKRFKIKKHEIPSNIEAFAQAIEKIFGLGASFLEILIMKRLYERVGGSFDSNSLETLTFTEYVAVAKRSFLKNQKTMRSEKTCFHYEKATART